MDNLINRITIGDARELAKQIPNQSVDMIFCDPLYDQTKDYEWLAMTAQRVLKPDKACLVFCSDIKMFRIQQVMRKYLNFVKPLYYTVRAKTSCLRGYNVFTWTTPCLWFALGNGLPRKRTIDTVISTALPPRAKERHKFNKNLEAYHKWVNDFTHPNDIILDPFTGSGSLPLVCSHLKRRFIAFEIDPDEAILARERLEKLSWWDWNTPDPTPR